MRESKRLARVHRLKALWQDTSNGSRRLFVLGGAPLAAIVWLLTLNDIDQTIGWIGLLGIVLLICWALAAIFRGVGGEVRDKILHRDF